MIHLTGEYFGASKELNGDLIIKFSVDEDMKLIEDLKKLDGTLVIEIDKLRKKRSLNANGYMWYLCNEIAKAIKSDKDTVYLMELSRYGVYVDVMAIPEALPMLQAEFRYVQVMNDGGSDIYCYRCYLGSSKYDTKQMKDLLDGITSDCADINVSTWSQEEVDYLLEQWKGAK